MRRWRLIPFIMALGLVGVWLIPARSELRVVEATIDLGQIRGGRILTHTFEISNPGRKPLEITEVERGCGCLSTRVTKNRLESGDKTTLSLELRTLGQTDGQHVWNLQVHYRVDAESKTLPLALRGVIRSEINVQPALVGMHVAKEIQQVITLTDSRATPLRVLRADTRLPGVEVTAIERDGKTTRFIVTADAARMNGGRHEGFLTIATDDAEYDQLQVPITVTKDDPAAVRAVPERVAIRASAATTTASALVRLRSNSEQAVRIALLEPSDPAVTATWASGPGNDATVKIQVQSGRALQGRNASIRIHLSAPSVSTITVPIDIVGAD